LPAATLHEYGHALVARRFGIGTAQHFVVAKDMEGLPIWSDFPRSLPRSWPL
jgi:membrane-associated protease RseP (regulator of RpoE activity)